MRKNSESGYILVTVAALLFVLVGFTALAVDMGTILSSRTQIQRAADAAALAGAFTFTVDPSMADQPGRASLMALKTATSNTVMGNAIDDAEVTVSVDLPDPSTNKPGQVTVTILRNEPTVFARILDVNGVANKVTAVAESSTKATGSTCVKPFFIPNSAFSTKDACSAATTGELLVSGTQTTPFAKSRFGAPMTLKPSDPHQSMTPGQFFEIDIAGGGAAGYSNNIAHCSTFQMVCQNSYDVLTGNKMGPTVQGIRDLIGQPPRDTYVAVGEYQTPDGLTDISKALVLAPIWDITGESIDPWGPGGFCPPPVGTCADKDPTKGCQKFPGGSSVQVKIIGFALMFVENAGSGDVTARLINVLPCGASAPSPNDVAAFAVPLRLVRK